MKSVAMSLMSAATTTAHSNARGLLGVRSNAHGLRGDGRGVLGVRSDAHGARGTIMGSLRSAATPTGSAAMPTGSLRSAATTTASLASEDKLVVGGNPSAGFKCANILNTLEVHPNISFDCKKTGKAGKCTANCASGKPMFIWPDGKKVEKSVFLCKGNKWLPPKGRLFCG